MAKQVNKEKITITLDLDVHAYILERADKESRSLSSMINVLLKGLMEKEKP